MMRDPGSGRRRRRETGGERTQKCLGRSRDATVRLLERNRWEGEVMWAASQLLRESKCWLACLLAVAACSH